MKRGGFGIVCLAGIFALCPMLRANITDASPSPNPPTDSVADAENPYSAIWTRNVFDLKPAEDKNALADKEAAPPSNVKLIGIYTLFGKRALLSVQEQNSPSRPARLGVPGRPAQAPGGNKEEFYNMSEGERHGALEVLEINPGARSVKIKNDDLVSTLTFDTNNASSGMNGLSHHPGPGPDANGLRPPRQFGIPNMGGMGGTMPIPNRSPRSSAPNYYGGAVAGGFGQPAPNTFVPGANYNPPAPLPDPNTQLQPPTLTSEQQAAIAAGAAAFQSQSGSQTTGVSGLPAGVPPPPTSIPTLPQGLRVPNR